MTVSNSVLAGAAHTRDGRTPLNTRPAQREPVRDSLAPVLSFPPGAPLARGGNQSVMVTNDKASAGQPTTAVAEIHTKEVTLCNCHPLREGEAGGSGFALAFLQHRDFIANQVAPS